MGRYKPPKVAGGYPISGKDWSSMKRCYKKKGAKQRSCVSRVMRRVKTKARRSWSQIS